MYKLNGLYNFDYATKVKTLVGICDKLVIRVSDGLLIPVHPSNPEYQKYLEWVAAGNTPEPADEPN
jgi:hypothetical protein